MRPSDITRLHVMIPNEDERKLIFYSLKKSSSYTAWNRIFCYYRAWAKAAEDSVREASERGWLQTHDKYGNVTGGVAETRSIDGVSYTRYRGTSISENEFVRILNGLAHCEEGVLRLRKGDKRVFKHDANGEFAIAWRLVDFWSRATQPNGRDEVMVDQEYTPNWPVFLRTLRDLVAAWGECSTDVLESKWLDDAAPNIYGVWMQENLPKMEFPDRLPDVPDPHDQVLVSTGRVTPVSGIWEPVDAPKPRGLSLFRDRDSPKGPLPVIGCMNYLHAGSIAPQARQETTNESLRADVAWRLLWRDDRYEDGTIPGEEDDYFFGQPKASEIPLQPIAQNAPPALITCLGGLPAPCAGRWALSVDHTVHVQVLEGELLPATVIPGAVWVFSE